MFCGRSPDICIEAVGRYIQTEKSDFFITGNVIPYGLFSVDKKHELLTLIFATFLTEKFRFEGAEVYCF